MLNAGSRSTHTLLISNEHTFIYPFRHTCWLDSGYRTNKQWTVERPHTAALSVINRLNILEGKQTNSEMIQSLLTFEWRRKRGKAPELVLSLTPLAFAYSPFFRNMKKRIFQMNSFENGKSDTKVSHTNWNMLHICCTICYFCSPFFRHKNIVWVGGWGGEEGCCSARECE